MCLQNISTQYYCAGNDKRILDGKSPKKVCN